MKALSILSVSHFSLGGWWLYESLESLCKHTQWALININWAQRDPQLSGARWSAHFLLNILSHPNFAYLHKPKYTEDNMGSCLNPYSKVCESKIHQFSHHFYIISRVLYNAVSSLCSWRNWNSGKLINLPNSLLTFKTQAL